MDSVEDVTFCESYVRCFITGDAAVAVVADVMILCVCMCVCVCVCVCVVQTSVRGDGVRGRQGVRVRRQHGLDPTHVHTRCTRSPSFLSLTSSWSLCCRLTPCVAGAVTKIRFVPASALVVAGCVDGRVRLWGARAGACVRTMTGHREDILGIDLSAYVLSLVAAHALTFSVAVRLLCV